MDTLVEGMGGGGRKSMIGCRPSHYSQPGKNVARCICSCNQ